MTSHFRILDWSLFIILKPDDKFAKVWFCWRIIKSPSQSLVDIKYSSEIRTKFNVQSTIFWDHSSWMFGDDCIRYCIIMLAPLPFSNSIFFHKLYLMFTLHLIGQKKKKSGKSLKGWCVNVSPTKNFPDFFAADQTFCRLFCSD